MRNVTRAAIKQVLTDELALESPQFVFENYGGRLTGSVISPTFRRRSDHQRQKLIWEALERAFGADVIKKVGLLLAYTPDEWNVEDAMDDSALGQLSAPTRKK